MTDDNKEDLEIDLDAALDAAKDGKVPAKPEVEIIDAEPAPKVAKAAEKSPEEGIEELKAKLEAERLGRLEAEKRARQAQMDAQKASTEVEDTNLHLVNSAIETVKQQSVLLKRQYAEAMAAQDFAQVSEIQEAMGDLAVKKSQLEAGKSAMENRPKAQLVQPMARTADPIEDIANQVTPQSAAWLRQNKAHLGSDAAVRRMFRAHEDAMDDGIRADTPAYFQFIEQRLGISEPKDAGAEIDVSTAASQPVQRRQSPPAAPVSRSGTANGSRPNTVRLSADEREMAAMMNMTDQEYAVNKLALQKAGKLAH